MSFPLFFRNPQYFPLLSDCSQNMGILTSGFRWTDTNFESHRSRLQNQSKKVKPKCKLALQGYSLSTSSNPAIDFELPSVSIPANGYTLIYTTGGTVGSSQAGLDLLTSLPLSSNGGSVVLLDSSGNIASAVQYPRCGSLNCQHTCFPDVMACRNCVQRANLFAARCHSRILDDSC